jgi:hypothetical protein
MTMSQDVVASFAAEEITTLVDTARSANVSNYDFAHDMRRLMQLPETQKISKKFLRETMTMAQYNMARAHYGEKLRRILEEDVPDHGSTPKDEQPHASQAASQAGDEPNATEAGLVAAKAKLRAEALSWGVREGEVDHILTHHPLVAARTILWKARRHAGAPLMAAAD